MLLSYRQLRQDEPFTELQVWQGELHSELIVIPESAFWILYRSFVSVWIWKELVFVLLRGFVRPCTEI